MAITDLGLLGTGSSKTAATTLAVTNTTGAIIPAGTFIHITGCWDNIASVTPPTITCSTVGGATATLNHINAAGSGGTTTAGSGVWHQCFKALTTADIAIGATIATLTSNQSAVARAAHAQGWSGVTTTPRQGALINPSTTGSPSIATTTPVLVTGDLVIGSVSFENNAQMTGDADTLNGSWSAIVGTFTTGSSAATNVGSGSQGKVVTATGAQTYNPTGGVADTIACVYSLVPAPDPTVTQASYRFYADGTEAGSTALAAQDTAYTADVTAGDVNLQLRTRLQSTNVAVLSGTDDWQLQWEKNANGLWSTVSTANEKLVDTYDESNRDVNFSLAVDSSPAGQSFLGDGGLLTRASFLLARNAASSGNVSAALYAHTGTFGGGGTGTGTALATSTSRSVSPLQLTPANTWEDFIFDGTFTLVAGTPYVIAVTTSTPATDPLLYSADGTSPTHNGNRSTLLSGVWTYQTTPVADQIFRIFTTPSAVVPFNSANLTEGAATTNRLGAGTNTFVAGKVSEDGLVDDLGWTGNNYTELLYALTLQQANLTNGDTLRFRVLRNGATTGLTYTAVPTIPITTTVAALITRPFMVDQAINRASTY